jgi:hypothetical protein
MEPAAGIGVFRSRVELFMDRIMDRKTEQAPKDRRKTVVILSDRSREIIRLFEERQQNRLRAEQSPQMQSSNAFRPSSGRPPQSS